MKVDELRAALRERNLDDHGVKQVLQQRLRDALDNETAQAEGAKRRSGCGQKGGEQKGE
jgi:hypothetical protein